MSGDEASAIEVAMLRRNLERLEMGIESVRRGEAITIDVDYDDEHPIGALAQAVNEMSVALRAAEADQRSNREVLEERLHTIGAQQAAILELSSPVIEVWERVLTLPIVGYVDAERATAMTTSLLDEVVGKRAKLAIVDLTGMHGVGAEVCDHVLRMARCVRLLGAECCLSGVRPEVARMMVEVGADLGELRSYPTLRAALAHYVGDLRKHGARSATLGAR